MCLLGALHPWAGAVAPNPSLQPDTARTARDTVTRANAFFEQRKVPKPGSLDAGQRVTTATMPADSNASANPTARGTGTGSEHEPTAADTLHEHTTADTLHEPATADTRAIGMPDAQVAAAAHTKPTAGMATRTTTPPASTTPSPTPGSNAGARASAHHPLASASAAGGATHTGDADHAVGGSTSRPLRQRQGQGEDHAHHRQFGGMHGSGLSPGTSSHMHMGVTRASPADFGERRDVTRASAADFGERRAFGGRRAALRLATAYGPPMPTYVHATYPSPNQRI